MYPLEGKQLTREEVRVMVAEAHVWQKRADLRRADLRNANLIGTDLREADLHEKRFYQPAIFAGLVEAISARR